MTVDATHDPEIESPQVDGPHPGAVWLFAGMVIAPFAWALQMLVCYAVAAHACYPTDLALGTPLWGNLRPILIGASAVFWGLLCVGCGIAWRNWRVTHPRERAEAETHGTMQSGTGRRRFMALCGVLVSALFAFVLLATSVSLLWVPSCGP